MDGDNYIIAPKNDACDDALLIYKIMDMSVNEIPTGIYVNNDEYNFIVDNIERIMAYSVNNILDKLIADIKTVVEFFKIISFWKPLNKTTIEIYQSPEKSCASLIFNKLYNVAIYVDQIDAIRVAKYFPEMYVVYSDEYNQAISDIFHFHMDLYGTICILYVNNMYLI